MLPSTLTLPPVDVMPALAGGVLFCPDTPGLFPAHREQRWLAGGGEADPLGIVIVFTRLPTPRGNEYHCNNQ